MQASVPEALAGGQRASRAGSRERLRLPAPGAWRDATAALVGSRIVVFVVGMTAFAVHGAGDPRVPHLGRVLDIVVAPISRWDAVHLQVIASRGYVRENLTAFYPLYPLLSRAVGTVTGSLLLGGALVSLVSFLIALVVLHKLAELELGADAARRTVLLLAFFPAALFFSAFYTESLFLALSVAAFYLARSGRWGWACALAGLASATRNSGVLLFVPIALLYLYGPRGDRPPPAAGRSWRPRFPVRRDVLWLALVPAGFVAYAIYQAHQFGDPLASLHAQTFWSREFKGPLAAVWYAIPKTGEACYELFTGSHDGFESPISKLANAGALALAFVAIAGMFRRLPPAYGAYTVLALLLPLSSPVPQHPLMSVPRYMAVLFPIHMWMATHTADRRRLAIVLVASGAMLAVLSLKFSTWGWAG